jgi:hypothetical protein
MFKDDLEAKIREVIRNNIGCYISNADYDVITEEVLKVVDEYIQEWYTRKGE